MHGISSRRLLLSLGLCAAVAAAQSACSNDATSPQDEDRPVLSTAVLLTVGGPAEINRSGYYTYGARLGANYASFSFYSRRCPTFTVATCTTPWSIETGIKVIDPYTRQLTRYLTYNCDPKAPKTFQVRVIASGFAVPQQTGYVVTKLCGSILA